MRELDERQIALLAWLQRAPVTSRPRRTQPADPPKAWAFIRACQTLYVSPWLATCPDPD